MPRRLHQTGDGLGKGWSWRLALRPDVARVFGRRLCRHFLICKNHAPTRMDPWE
ncbi:hypothetical protein [Acetobacter sp.]|uniref:hypothetical protein n=1 Tax=Acetobacter sp. TaxID=440 RepID=UPI0039E7A9C1